MPVRVLPRVPHIFEADSRSRLPFVGFYSDPYGRLIRVTERALPNRLAQVDDMIIGVVINGGIYPIYNRCGEQILARSHNGRHVKYARLMDLYENM